MKNSLRLLALAALAAMPIAGRAQATYYVSSDTSGSTTLLGFNSAIQTFSGFSNISSLSWTVTNFGAPATATFNAYVAQWNSGTSTITGALTPFGAANVSVDLGSLSSGQVVFNDTWTPVDSSLTYALVLTSTDINGANFTANTGTIPGGSDGAFFGSTSGAGTGAGYSSSSLFTADTLPQFTSDLQGTGSTMSPGTSYAMTVGGTAGIGGLSAVPEPKTAAAEVAALFVAALVGRRVWQRRKVAATPIAA